jgi:hypothetical protein
MKPLPLRITLRSKWLILGALVALFVGVVIVVDSDIHHPLAQSSAAKR